ncbi:MAG: hypothetical protein Q4A78_08350 [Peptostreptococcaceae bacterium]|nr:hypothetical protein [Peptostreptococcaceae bacterium]
MKYMVMECHRSYAVVLSEDGSFSKVANLQYEIGQIVDEIYEIHCEEDIESSLAQTRETAKPIRKKTPSWIYSLSGLAAALILVLTAVFQLQNGVYGSVYIQINPSVQIDVDRKDKVVDLKGINEDGKKLISSYSYKGKVLNTVMDEMIDLAVDHGFLEAGRTVALTFDAKDDDWVIRRGDQAAHHMEEHIRHLFPDAVSEASEDPAVHIITIPTASQEEERSDEDQKQLRQKTPSPVTGKPKTPQASPERPQEQPHTQSPSPLPPQNPTQPLPLADDDDEDEDDEEDDARAPLKDRSPNIYDRNNEEDDNDDEDEDDD